MNTSHATKTHRRHRCRPPAPPADPQTSAIDDLATSMSDAVGRIIRSLDPARSPSGLAAGAAATSAPHGASCHCHECCTCGTCNCCADDCCPPRCGPDPCHCSCCIGDADVVVYARVGETRVVPISVENRRSRERPVEVDLGEFFSKGGRRAPVVAKLLTPSKFTIAPCSEEEIVVVVRVGPPGDQTSPRQPIDEGRTKAELAAIARERGVAGVSSMSKEELIGALGERPVAELDPTIGRDVLIDVDDCEVAIADLRLTGCDHRPIRIAVAVLPRDCGRYAASCGCSCCC